MRTVAHPTYRRRRRLGDGTTRSVQVFGVGKLVVSLAAALSAFALGPASASAARIYIETGLWYGPAYHYLGETGERNFLTVQDVGGRYRFTESGGPTIQSSLPSSCTRINPVQVDCNRTTPSEAYTLVLDTKDGNDYIDIQTFTTSQSRWGAQLGAGKGADTLLGSPYEDWMYGDETQDPPGDDTIDGRGGPDFMYGFAGSDTVTYASRTHASTTIFADPGGAANDGAPGEGDLVHSSVENLTGSGGPDLLVGNSLDNVLRGGPGNDELQGRDLNDSLVGGDDRDRLSGGAGGDVLEGEGGDDVLDGGPEGDSMIGGSGQDQVDYSARTTPVAVKLDDYNTFGANDGGVEDGALPFRDHVDGDIEELIGGSAADRLTGDQSAERLVGSGGPDNLSGVGGNDTLEGGDADDQLDGGSDDDILGGDNGNDLLEGGSNADALSGGAGIDTADYTGHSYYDAQTGEAFGSRVSLDGVANDGHDPNSPVAIDEPATGVFACASSACDEVGGDEGDVERVLGSPGRDVFTGNGLRNTLVGGPEDDSLFGFGRADLLDPGPGADTASGGAGVDTLTYAERLQPVAVRLDGIANDGADPNRDGFSSSAEERDRDIGIENAIGGTGPDTLYATATNVVVNVLRGLGGNDRIRTREGTATVDHALCGAGADEYDTDSGDTSLACENAVVLP